MVWEILNPWWLALGFLVVVLLAIRSIPAHVSNLALLIIELVLAILMSVALVGVSFGYSPANLLAWLMGIALALLVNDFMIRSPRGVFFVPTKKRFIFPGSWLPLIAVLGLAGLYYAFKLGQYWQLDWVKWVYTKPVVCFGYGFLGGLFLAFFMQVLRSQKERAIGTSPLSKVSWTVAKYAK